ncbi:dephospho-CoA kinase [Candidatus Electrothrix marina]|uniref:Dephospho-CoA kinase n=1 Tax=Candidatus Electrothrix marina TaxID=1859130 RepID=A0A444JCX0_9BACT|nr:dephospho-CoA kinase [Candidatus Electrothrix marina]
MVEQQIKQQIIGITGGIGSGKSSVCSFLSEEYRFPLLSLDIICRDLLRPQEAGWRALRDFLPDAYFTRKGELDRQRFRRRLFADSALRSQVDTVLHPLARQEMEQQIASLITGLDAGPDAGLNGPILIEIPLLFEAGWQESVDMIIVVYADMAVRLQRIMQRDQVSEEQAKKAVTAQQCLREKAASADHVIDNTGLWEQTCSQVRELVASDFFS